MRQTLFKHPSTSVAVVGITLLYAQSSAFGFGGKRGDRQDQPVTEIVIPKEQAKVSSVSLRLQLDSTQDKVTGLGKTGSVVFEQAVSAPTPHAEEKAVSSRVTLKCEIPISVEVSRGKKALDTSMRKKLAATFKKLSSAPHDSQDFRTGFFTKKGTEVMALTQATLGDLMGEYEMIHIPELKKLAPSPEVAPLNQQGIGFVLAVKDDFRKVVKLKISPTQSNETENNVLCKQIAASGFTVNKP